MTMRVLVLAVLVCIAGCGKKKSGNGTDGGGNIDASHPCGVFGTPCSGNASCCSNICDPTGNCAANPTVCSQSGASCSANTDCCSVSCVGGVCSNTQCTADGAACTADSQCCGGSCTNGTCAPLNATCKTDGNPCAANTDCCSKLCNPSHVCGPSSYCTQDGDACAHDSECCGGICQKASGATLGTCTYPMTGSTNCSGGEDGKVCGGCGDCCSRNCELYQPTGVTICQPAEGCRVNGDTCHQDSDCCGAAGTGLPGDGNVVCLKVNPTDTTGVCRNPQSCNPEGDVCHYQNYMTCGNSSARNDCCGGVGNSGVCKLDTLGIPRCFGLGSGCVMAGSACSNALDCCNGAPCVPDQNGQLQCGSSSCVAAGGMCTNTADCCNGTTCVFQPGQTYGTCGGMSTCAQQGQTCNDMTPCCDNISCVETGTTTACPAGMETGCTCFIPIL